MIFPCDFNSIYIDEKHLERQSSIMLGLEELDFTALETAKKCVILK